MEENSDIFAIVSSDSNFYFDHINNFLRKLLPLFIIYNQKSFMNLF